MDVADIELIKTILHCGSLSEASEKLSCSQPTLSRRLSRLEDKLNTKLFYRSPKGLQPTEIAHFIIDSAKPLDLHLKSMLRHVELYTQLDTGRITIGVGPIIEQLLAPTVLPELLKRTGSVEIAMVVADDQTLLRMLDASEADVIIGPFDQEANSAKELLTIPMLTDAIVAVTRADHPLQSQSRIKRESLKRQHWAIPKTSAPPAAAEKIAELVTPKFLTDDYALLKRMTLQSDLICAGPSLIFRDEVKNGLLRELAFDLDMVWSSVLIARRQTACAPLVKSLISLCESAASGMSKPGKRPD